MAGDSEKLVPVRINGQLGTIPESQLHELPEGSEIASDADLHAAELQATHGGLGGQAIAGASGLASGLTFGGSDAAARALGYGDENAAYSEANPNARLGGEVVGAIAPALVPGGAEAEAPGLAARIGRAFTAPTRLLADAGGLVERGVAGALSREGAGLAERAAVKGLAYGAQGALEGAAYGAGHAVSEAELADTDVTAEKLLAGAKGGALMGLLGGGILGAGGEVGSTTLRAIADKGATLLGEHGGGLAEAAERLANEEAFKAVGGNKNIAKRADEFFEGGVNQFGKRVREETEEALGKTFGAATREDLPAVIEHITEKATKKLDESLSAIDDIAARTGQKPKLLDVLEQLHDEVVKPLAKSVAGESGERAIEGAITRTLKTRGIEGANAIAPGEVGDALKVLRHSGQNPEMSFRELRDLRAEFDKLWKGARADVNASSPLREARNQLEGQLMKRAETAVEGYKPGASKALLDGYREGKELYQLKSMLGKAVENGSAGGASNRWMGMGEHLGTIAGGVVGGLPGAAIGNAIGHLAKTRGGFVGADLAARAAETIRAIQSKTGAVDAKIANGVRGFLSGAPAKVRSAVARVAGDRSAGVQDQYTHAASRVAALASNPDLHVDIAAARTRDMADHAPATTASVARATTNAAAYLQSRMPGGHLDKYSLTPHLEKPRVSDGEAADWLRKVRVVENPLKLIDSLKHGDVTSGEVDALAAVYPRMYEQVRQEVLSQLTESKKTVPYAQKVQLGVLLKIPTDATLAPDFLQSVAASYAAAPAGDSQPPSPPPAAPAGSAYATTYDKVASS